MQTKTEIDRAALMASIEKWERNAVAKTFDDVLIGPNHCPLCKIYLDDDCAGCPIYAKSGVRYCSNTPYYDCEQAYESWEISKTSKGSRKQFQTDARAEVDFLRAVLAELPA